MARAPYVLILAPDTVRDELARDLEADGIPWRTGPIDHEDLPAAAILEVRTKALYVVALELRALGVPFVVVGERSEEIGALVGADGGTRVRITG